MTCDLCEFIQICDSDIIFWSMNVFSLTYFITGGPLYVFVVNNCLYETNTQGGPPVISCVVFSRFLSLIQRKPVLRNTVVLKVSGFLFSTHSPMSFALNVEDEDIFVFDDLITARSPFDFRSWIVYRLYQLQEN